LAALVRGPQAQQRWLEHLNRLELSNGSEIKLIVGDLSASQLCLQVQDREWLSHHCRGVLHCAGVVKFLADGRLGEPYLTNYEGTRQLLSLCQQLNLDEFHHVSTAYVCGKRQGLIYEHELDLGQTFHNDYERSKFLAEQAVHAAHHLKVRHIYRPSVILGSADTGFTPTFKGAYELLWLGWNQLLSGLDRASFLRLLNLKEDDGLNLVTADWVAQAVLHLVLQANPGKVATFHLSNAQATPWVSLLDVLLELAPSLPPSRPYTQQASAEGRLLDAYLPYLKCHPQFDTLALTHSAPQCPCPNLGRASLEKLARYAIENGFESHDLSEQSRFLESLPKAPLPLIWAVQGAGKYSCEDKNRRPASQLFCSSRTLAALRGQKLTAQQALERGQLILSGPSESYSPLLNWLDGVFAE
jgi:thioester reductase-like protein